MGFVTIVTGIALLGQDYGIGGGITPVLVASGLWWLALGKYLSLFLSSYVHNLSTQRWPVLPLALSPTPCSPSTIIRLTR